MIPKVIHYCWFGQNQKSDLALKCIRSWKKKCPDYKIIEWNESNYEIKKAPLYVRQAYEAKKWAFVTDYVRLAVIYENGGIYLDTDVEIKRSLDDLLFYNAYFGFESKSSINTGCGFGAVKGCSFLNELMSDYQDIKFKNDDGTFNYTTCCDYNLKHFLNRGLVIDDSKQILKGNILILPSIYLSPINLLNGMHYRSIKTYSVHWYDASWKDVKESKIRKQKFNERKWNYILHTPHRLLLRILGGELFENQKLFWKIIWGLSKKCEKVICYR